MKHLTALALAAALVVTGAPLQAGALSDLVLAPGVFAAAEPAWPLSYDRERRGPGAAPPVNETLALAPADLDGVRRLVLTRAAAGEDPREITSFSLGTSNPVLLYFLEAATRTMAEATGGSPFYIRNRIREALGGADLGTTGEATHGGAPVAVRQVTLAPFAGDPNRGRMGEFADLAIAITVAPDLPGRILALSADTPAPETGYHERMILVPEVR